MKSDEYFIRPREKTERVFKLLSIIIIVTLVGSLVTQVEISSVSALSDPATGIKASSKFGTLQIDHSEYDVTYVNSTTVKVNGTIATLNSIDTKMTILFTLPDGTPKGSQIPINGDGTFQTSFSLDSNSQKGTYSVSASYAQNTLGALTFTVKQVPVSKSAFPISPTPIQSPQNNPSVGTANTQQNIPTQLNPNSIMQSPSKLPKWIKSTFILYAQGEISEDELLDAITFLVQNNIIKIQSVSQPSTTTNTSPSTTTNQINNVEKFGTISYQVTGVSLSSGDGYIYTPKGIFLVVSVKIENLGNAPVTIMDTNFGLQDKNGRTYSVDHMEVGDQFSYLEYAQPNTPFTENVFFDLSLDKNIQYDLLVYGYNQFGIPDSNIHNSILLGMGRDFG